MTVTGLHDTPEVGRQGGIKPRSVGQSTTGRKNPHRLQSAGPGPKRKAFRCILGLCVCSLIPMSVSMPSYLRIGAASIARERQASGREFRLRRSVVPQTTSCVASVSCVRNVAGVTVTTVRQAIRLGECGTDIPLTFRLSALQRFKSDLPDRMVRPWAE